MRNVAKRIAVGLGIVVGLAVVLVAGLVLFLSSSAGSRFLLGKAAAAAADAGWKMTARAMTLDVFHRLHLENVRLTRGDDVVAFSTLDVVYRIGVFPPSLAVENVLLADTQVRVHGKDADEPSPEPSEPSGEGVETARRWLERPPASITVKTFTITNLQWDYENRTPGGTAVAAQGKLKRLTASLTILPENFAFDLTVDGLGMDSWSFASASATGSGTLLFDGAVRLSATKTDSGWLEHVAAEKTSLTAGASGTYGEKHRPWSIDRLRIASSNQGTVRAPTPLSIDRWKVEKLEGSAGGVIDGVSVGGASPLVAWPDFAFEVTGSHGANVRIEAKGKIPKLTLAGVHGAMAAAVDGSLEAPLDFHSLALRGRGIVEGRPIAEGGLDLQAGEPTKIESWGTLLLPASLARRAPATASIAGTDGARGKIELHGTVGGKMTHVLDAPTWEKAPIASTFAGSLSAAGRRDPKLSLGDVAAKGTLGREHGAWKMTATLRTDRLVAGGADVREPRVETEMTYTADGVANARLEGHYRNEKFLDLAATMEGEGHAKGEATATLTPALAAHLGKDVGRWTTHASFANHHRSGVHQFEAAGEVTQFSATPSPLGAVKLAGPATWRLRGKYAVADATFTGAFDGELPAIDVADVGRSGALRANATLSVGGAKGRRDIRFAASAKQEKLQLKKSVAPGLPALAGLRFDAKASVQNGQRFTLDELEASFGDELVAFTGSAAGRIDRGSYQMGVKLSSDVPKTFPIVAGQRFAGHLEIPLTVNVGGGRDINIDGDVLLSNVQWSKNDMALSGIHGRVPLQYQLVREDGTIRFAYLMTQNPFERVDYERLRPLLARAEQVRVDEVRFSDRKYGPIVGVFSMRQNLLFAHSFDASFGKSGSLGGEFFADLNPNHLRVGLLSRLTAVNLTEVLPTRSLVRVPTGTQTVSGRCGIVVDLKSGTADGRVDITEIGAAQLVTLINAMDPTFENEKLNTARTALSLGYPTFVGAKLERGYMDLSIDLRLLGTAHHFDVPGVPLSTFLASAFADARTDFAKEKNR